MQGVEWFQKSTIYHILIDRFAGYHSPEHAHQPVFIGGTLQGIVKKLDYLENLGVNTVWISPFYKTSAYHGYHITDFYQVDSHFGTLEDIKQLIREIHNRHMYIIADFVPNHCSREHPFFQHAYIHKNSEYQDWFYFSKWPDEYLCFLSIQDLPKLNLDNPQAKKHVIDAAVYWLRCGFDGFRLDHVIGPARSFWKEFRGTIKQQFPAAVLIGEAWMMGIRRKELKTLRVRNRYMKWFLGSASDSLFQEYVGVLDGVLDFRFQDLTKHFFTGQIPKKYFIKRLQRHYQQFPKNFYLPTFLDNHDMDRFLFTVGNDKEKLKQAFEFQCSLGQPIIVYYGSEIGMSQQRSIWDIPIHGDLQARQPMQWHAIDTELFNFYKKNIAKRNRNQ
ncbi:MAG: alpha-amylase family glycosyl hydrolase [Candidatus Thermoplasmatota archaeon]